MNNKLARSFCVPYNGDIELVKQVASDFSDSVFEFYGTDDAFTSGRTASMVEPAPIQYVMRVLDGSGIRFNYLLNSIVLDDYLVKFKPSRQHLAHLREIGVQTVTSSSPYFVNLLKSLGFEVSTSVMQHIRNDASLARHERLGYDRIILSEDEIRNVPLLRRLAASTELPLEILINNCCLKECPFRLTHYNAEGSRRPDLPNEAQQHLTVFCKQCKDDWYLDATAFLSSSWIRPEDLPRYKEVGISLFKITGRTIPSSSILEMLRIYSHGWWDGSIWSYLKPFAKSESMYGIRDIDNSDLGTFFEFFYKKGCDGSCFRCDHCQHWAQKLVRTVPEHRSRLLLPKGAEGLAG